MTCVVIRGGFEYEILTKTNDNVDKMQHAVGDDNFGLYGSTKTLTAYIGDSCWLKGKELNAYSYELLKVLGFQMQSMFGPYIAGPLLITTHMDKRRTSLTKKQIDDIINTFDKIKKDINDCDEAESDDEIEVTNKESHISKKQKISEK